MGDNAKIDLKEIQQKLYEKLKPSGWGDALKGFLISMEMETILQQLYDEQQAGERFTPGLKQIFRALELCPYERTNVIILSQDPYSYLSNKTYTGTVADGIAFSCGNDQYVQASLKYIHQDIQDTVYPDQKWKAPVDLKVWAEQGVLLLNIALTTTVNKVGTHYLLWRPFMAYLLDILGWNKPGLIWVFVGTKAREYMNGIPDNCYKLTCTHPAYAAHMKFERWDSGKLFVKINEILEKKLSKPKIIW